MCTIPRGYRNPRLAFYEDLDKDMRRWIDEGDMIILGIDANEDIHTGHTLEWITTWGLVDILHRTHPQLLRVATCNKNLHNTPIDAIWASPGLQIDACGMTGFGELYPDSDHRILWADITRESIFGFMAPRPAKRPVNSLPVRNPIAMRKYNKYVTTQLSLHNIPAKTFALEAKAQVGSITMEDAIEYNRILQIQQDIRKRARKKCRRFHTGQILYTDELGKIYRRRKLWKLYQIPMDLLMENGWGLHRDVVEGGQRLSRQERGNHVRVHHWNAFIDEMRSSDGLLPMFSSDIPLPVEVCSKKILRQCPKESGWGSRTLVLDLLVEDSKLPAAGSKKRGFEIVNDDDDKWGYDTDELTLSTVLPSKRTKKGNK